MWWLVDFSIFIALFGNGFNYGNFLTSNYMAYEVLTVYPVF